MPIDGSNPAYKALSHAVYIVQHNNTSLTLLYVIDINHEVSDFKRVSLSGYILENITHKGYELLAKLVHKIPAKIKTDISLEIDNPAEVIVNKAQMDNMILSSWVTAVLAKLKVFS